jgi:hypothetical protein
VVRRAAPALGVALFLALPVAVAAQGAPAPEAGTVMDSAVAPAARGPALTTPVRDDFCRRLGELIQAENAREGADFARSLDEAVAAARLALDKRVVRAAADAEEDEGAPPVTWQAEDALAVARYLWQRWMPTAPSAGLIVTEDGPAAWLIAPAPAPDPPYAGPPIRVAKTDGAVTWRLPHPSERERLRDRVCGGPAGE